MSPTEVQLLTAVVGLLAFIATTLVIIAVKVGSRRYGHHYALEINEAIARLGEATQHYTTVNAVLALTEQFQERPELMEKLTEYSRQVVAAALLTRANGIANDIKVVQRELSQDERNLAQYGTHYQQDVRRNRTRLAELQLDLDAVHAATEMFATTT